MSIFTDELAKILADSMTQSQRSASKYLHFFDEVNQSKDISISFPVRECSTTHLTGYTIEYKTVKPIGFGNKSLDDYTSEEIERANEWIRERILRSM